MIKYSRWRDHMKNKTFIKLIYKNTLSGRLLIYMLVGILLPLSLYFAITLHNTFTTKVNNYEEKTLNSIIFLTKIVGDYYTSIKNLPLTFYDNSVPLDYIQLTDEYTSISVNAEIYNYIKNFYYNRDDIEVIRFYSRNILTVLNKQSENMNRNEYLPLENLSTYISYTEMVNPENRFFISPTNSEEGYFTVNQYMYDFDNTHLLSILSMDINSKFLDTQVRNLNLRNNENFYIFNSKGNLMYQTADRLSKSLTFSKIQDIILPENKGYTRLQEANENYILVYSWVESHEFVLVRTLPTHLLYKDILPSFLSTLSIVFILILLIALISLLIYRSVSVPITRIVDSMRYVEKGNFNVRMDYKASTTELALLIEKFNLMTEEIDQLFKEQIIMKVSQQNAELQALQQQINPHFLYNTLQTVQYMAIKRGAYEIDSIITALADIMKYTLRNEKHTVSLEEELEYVNKFLLIQRFKYTSDLLVTMDIDDTMLTTEIPKMTLQPLIENCFAHGFNSVTKGFKIHIETKNTDDYWIIRISDNGKGFTQRELTSLSKELSSTHHNINYEGLQVGLKNVNARLKLLYKNEAWLKIYSTPFEISTIEIIITKHLPTTKLLREDYA